MIIKSEQGKGLGRAAINHWIKLAKEKGYKELKLSVVPDKQGGAEKIYEKIGFKNIGVIEQNEVVMQIIL